MSEHAWVQVDEGARCCARCWDREDAPDTIATCNMIDLGHDHWMNFIRVGSDPRGALKVMHRCRNASPEFAPYLMQPAVISLKPGISNTHWNVEAWEPLSLSPSLLFKCCGDHGFIRLGRWVPA